MAYHPHRKPDDIHGIVAGRQLEILTALGIKWNPAHPRQHIRCPFPGHTDAHPSWRWDHNKGIAYCTCGHADIFGVVMKLRGYGSGKEAFRNAADYCRDVLGEKPWPASSARPKPDHLHVVDEPPASETKAPPPWQRQIAAEFDYIDEHGEVLYQSVKFADSLEPRFMQRCPDAQGRPWKWSLKGIRRILYRLPELVAAAADKQTIYIAEGEKDVENLRRLGLTATTNPMGAEKWRPEYNEHLRDADVLIIGDNDEAGRNHVEQVAASLHGIAGRVRVLDLAKHWPQSPDKGDISDWIAAGGTVDQLAALIDAVPEWKPPGNEVVVDDWPIMDDAAYYGLAGRVTKTIAPHSEADPVAIHIQFLVYFGNAVGSCPYYQIESDRHHANLFAVLTGISSRGRKGTSGGRARAVMEIADEEWTRERMKGGLSSGEGFINEVRDEVKKYDAKAKQFEVIDPGVTDKRLMITEAEFGNALAVMERPGNTLSPTIRKAWDGHTLSTLTKNSPLKATGAHISISGHITEDELRAGITRTDMANGFANRFLFVCVRRSQLLPHGGDLSEDAIRDLGTRTAAALCAAKRIGQMQMNDAARQVWEEAYKSLSADQRGLLGAITARAEAQVIRLAMVYALLDGATEISVAHLTAATAVWEYCEASAARIFGNALGDPVADEILQGLRQVGASGMTRTAIRDLFGRHRSGDRIGAALALLMTKGRARAEVRTTGGRPSEIWFAKGEG
jgi:hypothetical protein